MPGNEVGDRFHNFFAQDNLSQGQHHSQAVDRNWPGLNSNLWAGSQRQTGVPNSSPKNYNIQQSDRESGHSINPLHARHDSNQSTLRPEFAKSPSQSQQPHLNGYVHGYQVFQTKQGETNFLGVDTESDRHNLTSRGLSMYESQQGRGPDYQTKYSVRSETDESPVGFDFFGGHEQISRQQSGRLQSLSQQQAGFNDMQQLQQEAVFRKMQELQRQQQLWQVDARQQNSINQFPSFAKQASGSHSHVLGNGTPISDASNYPFASELTASNTNRMQRSSPVVPGSSNGLAFSPDQSQAPCGMGLVPQPVDQSLYGVPVSSSRGSLNHYPLMMTDRPPMQQMSTLSNTLTGNQYDVIPDQVGRQGGTFISKHGFQGQNLFGHASGQCLSSGLNMENLQQINSLQRNASLQESDGRQELAVPSETLQGKTEMEFASSQTAVALDPTEEKILFGSDDNIWDAFGGSSNMTGGACNLLDGMESGFQSGSLSALMQSAVAETSSDTGIQEEWGGLSFPNTEIPTGNAQRNFPPSDDTNMNNNYQSVLGFQISSSQRLVQQSLGGGSKQLNHSLLQKSLTEGSQFNGNSCHSLDAVTNTKIHTGPWTPQPSGSNQPCNKPNNWNVPESVSPGGDEVFRIQENENPLQHAQINVEKKALHGEMSYGGDFWKDNSVPSSTVEGSLQENREGFNLNTSAVILNSSTTKADNQAGQFLSNSNHLPYWKKVDSSLVKLKGSEDLGKSQHHFNKGNQFLEPSLNYSDKEVVKMLETENCNKKENSNDSYHAHSHHTSTGHMSENVLSEASDSWTLPGGKQKSSSQTGRKTSATRKFQYHPMGNFDEDAEPSYGTRQATHSLIPSQQNSQGLKSHDQGQFGQSKVFGQASRTSSEMGKERLLDLQGDTKGFVEAPSRGILPGYVPNVSTCFDRPVGIYAPNKASQSSQNMLELLQKVDQSRECGTTMHFSSSEHNSSSEMPEAENSEGSVGRLQRSQSSASQGFVLELAPPTQRLPIPNHASYFQSSAQIHNYLSSTHTTPEMIEKTYVQLAPMNLVQYLPPFNETSQGEIRSNITNIPGQPGSEASLYKMPGNFSSAFSSSFPYAQNQLQNQYITGASGQNSTNQSIHTSSSRNASHFVQRDDSCSRPLTGQSADPLPDAAGSFSYDKSVSSGNKSHSTHTNHRHESATSPKISVGETLAIPQPFTTSGISQQVPFPKMSPNIWTNPPAQQHSLGALGRKVSSKNSQSHQSKHLEPTSSVRRNLRDQDVGKSGNGSSEFGTHSLNSQSFALGDEQLTKERPNLQESSGSIALAQKMNESLWKEPPIKHLTEAASVNPASTQGDIEAFGRSLKPNNLVHQNYSLLNQMRAIKAETEPSNRDLKVLKGDGVLDCHKIAHESGQSNECNTVVEGALVDRATIPLGDSKMLSFSGPAVHLERNASSQLGNVSSQDMRALGRNNSPNNFHDNNTSVRLENSQISPQMAPSWFNQYGTYKNGQMLPMYDAQKATIIKTLEQPFTLGKTSSSLPTLNSVEQVIAAVDTNQVGHTLETSTPGTLAIEHFSSPHLLPTDVSGQGLVALRPKKRKSATFGWHKEVSQGSPSLQTCSLTELVWARAANRITEKVEDDSEMIGDGPSLLRPKRRLILTTQLMQQLIHPPPATILSADASSNYESVAYFVARLVLGNACSVVSSSRSDSNRSDDSTSCLSGNGKTPQSIDDQYFLNVMEDFMDKARQLENDFLRLDKRASVLDVKVEYQDIEKFSVINRFAKFHGRGQADGADGSSSSDAAANVWKICPQRYVTALPLPKNLPDRVQCLSL